MPRKGAKHNYHPADDRPSSNVVTMYTNYRDPYQQVTDHLAGQIFALVQMGVPLKDVRDFLGGNLSISTIHRHGNQPVPPGNRRQFRHAPQPDSEKEQRIKFRRNFFMFCVQNQYNDHYMVTSERDEAYYYDAVEGTNGDELDTYWQPVTRQQMADKYKTNTGITVSIATVTADLAFLKVKYLSRFCAPTLLTHHRFERVRLCNLFLARSQQWRNLLIFTDEKLFTIAQNCDNFMYCPPGRKPLRTQRVQKPASVMVWGALWAGGLWICFFPEREEMLKAEIVELQAARDEEVRQAVLECRDGEKILTSSLFKLRVAEADAEFNRLKAKREKQKGIDRQRFIRYVVGPMASEGGVAADVFQAPGVEMQQDNARVHFTDEVKEAWAMIGVTLMDISWPSKSPDGSGIEMSWSWMARDVSRRGPRNRQQLIECVKRSALEYNGRGLYARHHGRFTKWCRDVAGSDGRTVATAKRERE